MPDDEFRPGAHDLETPFIFVPHGAPDPVEFKRKYPGWVSFPATFVPHPRPIPKWKVINGQRWPLDKRGRPWPKTRYGRPTCPFDELPEGFPAPGTQDELMRKLENPMLFFEGEPMPTVEEFSALAERLRAERAAAAPPPPVQRPKAYDGDGLGPARDYLDAMARVDQQLREFAANARQERVAPQAQTDVTVEPQTSPAHQTVEVAQQGKIPHRTYLSPTVSTLIPTDATHPVGRPYQETDHPLIVKVQDRGSAPPGYGFRVPGPSSPTGRTGNPIEVKPGTNQPDEINGRRYSGHALDRMQGRGLTPSLIEHTVQPRFLVGTSRGANVYYDPVNKIQVVTDPRTNVVITAITRSSKPRIAK